MRIKGRTALVTGASSGIGASTAVLLARRGAQVLAVGRNPERLAAVAERHPGITPFVADVTSSADRAGMVGQAEAVLGAGIDILVNNAGIGWAGRLKDMSADDVTHLFDTNVLGLIDLTHRVLPGMLERKCGHVSNIASVLSFVSLPGLGAYSAKFAVQGYTDALRRELPGTGVTATCIHPGPVATRFLPRAIVHDLGEVPSAPAGVPPWLVAFAIERGIRLSRLPGYGAISVPRPMGLLRLAELPGIRAALDITSAAFSTLFTRIGI
jgi:short-subunit dehydrogenase